MAVVNLERKKFAPRISLMTGSLTFDAAFILSQRSLKHSIISGFNVDYL